MVYTCNAPFYVGPLYVLAGAMILILTAMAWNLPVPDVIRLRFAPAFDACARAGCRLMIKLLGPPFGLLCLVFGLFAIWAAFQCQHVNLGIFDIRGPFALTWWFGVYAATFANGAIGIYAVRAFQNRGAHALAITGMFGLGFSGGQAASFRVGPHARQWGVIYMLFWVVVGIAYWMECEMERRRAS